MKDRLSQKREANSDDEVDDGAHDPSAISSPSRTGDIAEMEKRARKELEQFLDGKSLDSSLADKYKIVVSRAKRKGKELSEHSDGSMWRFSTSYVAPDGSIMNTRTDVINDIKQGDSRRRVSTPTDAMSSEKAESIAESRADYDKYMKELPVDLDDINVIAFGDIIPHATFHNPVQIFPAGYKVEMTVTGLSTSRRGASSEHVCMCEIIDVDGLPEFMITNKTNGMSYTASSEPGVWKKFDPLDEFRGRYSFFNLAIELVIEGMDGATECENYKFHVERGFGSKYTTNEKSIKAKADFLAKASRELRSQQRSQMRFMSLEDRQRMELSQKKLADDEKDHAKRVAEAEKERKQILKEEKSKRAVSVKEEKKRREDQAKADRERQKREEAEAKERAIALEKRARERQKLQSKARLDIRREVAAEVKHSRVEAASSVLKAFDREEASATLGLFTQGSDIESGMRVGDTTSRSLHDVIDSIPTCAESFSILTPIQGGAGSDSVAAAQQMADAPENVKPSLHSSPTREEVDNLWDDMFKVANYIHVLKEPLGLRVTTSLDHLIETLAHSTTSIFSFKDAQPEDSECEVDSPRDKNERDETATENSEADVKMEVNPSIDAGSTEHSVGKQESDGVLAVQAIDGKEVDAKVDVKMEVEPSVDTEPSTSTISSIPVPSGEPSSTPAQGSVSEIAPEPRSLEVGSETNTIAKINANAVEVGTASGVKEEGAESAMSLEEERQTKPNPVACVDTASELVNGMAKANAVSGADEGVDATAGTAQDVSNVSNGAEPMSTANEAIEGNAHMQTTLSNANNGEIPESTANHADAHVDSAANSATLWGVKNEVMKISLKERRSTRCKQAEADLDRLHLTLTSFMMSDLHTLLELDERVAADVTSKRERSVAAARLPLNQLTWPELARMALVTTIMRQVGRADDDIQTALRGGRGSNFRNSKNIMRYIRTRMLARTFAGLVNGDQKDGDDDSDIFGAYQQLADVEDRLALYTQIPPTSTIMKAPSLKALRDVSQSSSAEEHENSRTLNGTDNIELMEVEKPKVPVCEPENDLSEDEKIFFDEIEKLLQDASRHKMKEDIAVESTSYYSDSEMISSVNEVLSDSSAPDEYLRCAKIFLKIAHTSAAKSFYWEVDSELYPDYYETVRYPVMFTHIASKLVNRVYGEFADGYDPKLAASILVTFYEDMKTVLLNCISFNTEITTIHPQAQKLLPILWRYTYNWALSRSRPALSMCDDSVCMLSQQPIPLATKDSTYEIVKCSRCTAIISLDALDALTQKTSEAFMPSAEQLTHLHEEWYCPYCIQEDSTLFARQLQNEKTKAYTEDGYALTHQRVLESRVRSAYVSQSHYIDEWGPSAHIPWIFHGALSKMCSLMEKEDPSQEMMLASVRLLCNGSRSLAFDTEAIAAAKTAYDAQGENWQARYVQAFNDAVYARPCAMTVDERVKLLLGLCEMVLCSEKGSEVLQRQNVECEKLAKISEEKKFRERDFIETLKAIAGEDGAAHCRSMLHGAYSEEMDISHEVDNPEDESTCDAAHMKLDHIDDHRSRELEEELLSQLLDMKSGLEDAFEDDSDFDDYVDETECAYCGLKEFDICSPMVYGQSREEHDAWLAACRGAYATGALPDKLKTKINFFMQGEKISAPELEVPFYPLVRSKEGRRFKACCVHVAAEDLIVHESCALQMFQARMDRGKHTLRRRRRLIADKAINMSGICTRSLGVDDAGREYWKFPTSDDLLICLGGTRRPDPEDCDDLNRELGRPVLKSSQEDAMKTHKWLRVSKTDEIRSIVDLLGNSEAESSVRQNIVSLLLMDRSSSTSMKDAKECSSAVDDAGSETEAWGSTAETASNTESTVNGDRDRDDGYGYTATGRRKSSKPIKQYETSLQPTAPIIDEKSPANVILLPKGAQILPSYEIEKEDVFTDTDPAVEGDSEISYQTYFSFGRKYFAIGLTNALGKRVRAVKGALTVIYQVHREGKEAALVYTALTEPWADNIYYFSSLNFKRSGKYTISFTVEGDKADGVKPLVFPVIVEAGQVVSGLSAAIYNLNALQFINIRNRQSFAAFGWLNKWTQSYFDNQYSERESLRRALMLVYTALPVGSLHTDETQDNITLVEKCIMEPVGWNDVLDQAWRASVDIAWTPAAFMECVLLLEHYINNKWLAAPHNRLLNALPSPHFAMRCCTYASVALRIYSIDKAMLYDNVQLPSRLSRTGGRGGPEIVSSAIADRRERAGTGRAIKPKQDYYYEDEDVPRPRRAAAAAGAQRIQRQVLDNDIDMGDEGTGAGRRSRERRSRVEADMEYDPEVRTSGRKRNRTTYRDSDDEDDDVDSDDGDDDSGSYDEDDVDADNARTSSSRSRNRVNEEVAVVPEHCSVNFTQAIAALVEEIGAVGDPDGSLDMKARCYSILRHFKNDPQTAIFWTPVDARFVPDYHNFISEPMDLGTIGNHVQADFYGLDHFQFAKSVRLVWSNCTTYNPVGTPLHVYALTLSRKFEELYSMWIVSPDRPQNPNLSYLGQ